MTRRPIDVGDPDRLYTITAGRSRAGGTALDLVTLIAAECQPLAGMQSEHAQILDLCRSPIAVVEVAAELKLPITVVKILVSDLLASGRVTARRPVRMRSGSDLPDVALLEEVLHGLRNV